MSRDDGREQPLGGLGRVELERLWRRERRWVAAVLLAHMPRGECLEDLLQEVALSLVQHAGEVREPARIRAWLRTVAMNVARGAGRKVETRRRHGLEGADEDGAGDVSGLVDPSSVPDADRDEARQAVDQVLALAEGLPPGYREPLLLRCVRGLSQRRIAELLEVPETTVETRLARARRKLRDAWSRQRDCADVTDWET